MTNSKKEKMIRIFWEDAVIYEKPLSSDVFSLKKRITEGEVFKKGKVFFIIKNPITFDYDIKLKKYLPFILKRKISFFYIPKKMIRRTEYLYDIKRS